MSVRFKFKGHLLQVRFATFPSSNIRNYEILYMELEVIMQLHIYHKEEAIWDLAWVSPS